MSLSASAAHAQIGPFVTGQGPVNRSMGGAAVAAPIDAIGALYWNPATISALPNSMDFGVELVLPQTSVASTLPANSFGPGIPPITLSGSTDGSSGASALPSIGLIYRPADSNITFGLGLYAPAGFSVNYPASASNPILTPQPPLGFGSGNLYSNLEVLQIAPVVTVQLTEQLSFGIGPSLNIARLQGSPLIIQTPNANGLYPDGTHVHSTWGAGFQAGVFYTMNCWQFGASFKSKQYFESFHFTTTDAAGLPRPASNRFDLPMIPSLGVAYTGVERLLVALDVRYVDFANAAGFNPTGFDATGAVRGPGWQSVLALSLGAQYQLTDPLSVRAGYSWNQSPVQDDVSSFNAASPTIIQHALYTGLSYQITETFKVSAAYAHAFQNSVTGPLVTPFGALPGSSVTNTASADAFMVGASVKY